MKNPIFTCFIGLSAMLNVAEAFELPTIAEGNIADGILQWARDFKTRFTQEGTLNGFGGLDIYGKCKTTPIGIQAAIPLFVNKQSLYRFEYNFYSITESTDFLAYPALHESQSSLNHPQEAENFKVHKWGISGRYILNRDLIAGGYIFYDTPSTRGYWNPISWTLNPGLEFIWPRYGTLILDGVFNPSNLFKEVDEQFYTASIKLSKLKPQVLDIFVGASCIKHPPYPKPKLIFTLIGVKGRIPMPIKKWDMRKRVMARLQLTYSNKETFSRSNFGVSFNVQVDVLKSNIQNSLQDYLRMPIDRSVTVSHHPYQDPFQYSEVLENSRGPIIMFDEEPSAQDAQPDIQDTASVEGSTPEKLQAVTPKPSINTLRGKPSRETLGGRASTTSLSTQYHTPLR